MSQDIYGREEDFDQLRTAIALGIVRLGPAVDKLRTTRPHLLDRLVALVGTSIAEDRSTSISFELPNWTPSYIADIEKRAAAAYIADAEKHAA